MDLFKNLKIYCRHWLSIFIVYTIMPYDKFFYKELLINALKIKEISFITK